MNATGKDQEILLKCFDRVTSLPFWVYGDDSTILRLDKNAIYYPDFVEAIKFLMRTDVDMKRGYYLEFNSDYSKLRKLKPIGII